MDLDYHDTFTRIVAKVGVLTERYNILKESKAQADAKVKELQEEIRAKELELQQLRQEIKYLKMASVINPDSQQVESTRALISDLVREIDRCITDLTD